VTTPESLYVLLGSASGRKMLGTVRTVIVDEIHAIAASKRGSHLALSLERLQALCAEGSRPVRIGLSATQKPIDEVALPGRRRRAARRRPPTAPSSTSATPSSATWRSKCRQCRWSAVMANDAVGRRSTTAWPSWCGCTAPR
jgi:hypothetical protein